MRSLAAILLAGLVLNCCKKKTEEPNGLYKDRMREFVIGISNYAKSAHPNFFVIPQNGIELVSTNGDESGSPHTAYLNAIDGNGQEDLFYGYNNDDEPTPATDNTYLKALLDISKKSGKAILVTDYCSTPFRMNQSYTDNFKAGYVSFAANNRELSGIPAIPTPIFHENNAVISSLSQAKNFLYLINPEKYASKNALIAAVSASNYDLLIMDLFFKDGIAFTASEIASLRNKANGGKRLVICYMSIGEAEDYRYYWQAGWNSQKPGWLDAENPAWPGNYKVKYWNAEWQAIIFGNKDAYLEKILDTGFDGVYLDIIDAFEYYE